MEGGDRYGMETAGRKAEAAGGKAEAADIGQPALGAGREVFPRMRGAPGAVLGMGVGAFVASERRDLVSAVPELSQSLQLASSGVNEALTAPASSLSTNNQFLRPTASRRSPSSVRLL